MCQTQCPLYPRKQTWISTVVMSALGHEPTSANNTCDGRLPTSPRKIFATGRLKNANPVVAPHKAKLMIVFCQAKI